MSGLIVYSRRCVTWIRLVRMLQLAWWQ
jgi:hypothetical protein